MLSVKTCGQCSSGPSNRLVVTDHDHSPPLRRQQGDAPTPRLPTLPLALARCTYVFRLRARSHPKMKSLPRTENPSTAAKKRPLTNFK